MGLSVCCAAVNNISNDNASRGPSTTAELLVNNAIDTMQSGAKTALVFIFFWIGIMHVTIY